MAGESEAGDRAALGRIQLTSTRYRLLWSECVPKDEVLEAQSLDSTAGRSLMRGGQDAALPPRKGAFVLPFPLSHFLYAFLSWADAARKPSALGFQPPEL